MKIYVDGSVIRGKVRWAFIVVENGKIKDFRSGEVNKRNGSNVDAELTATVKALEYAKSLGVAQVELCYDYTGIEKFATGAWKPKTDVAIQYVSNMLKLVQDIKVEFRKVSKKNDNMNLAVDALARGYVVDMFWYAARSAA
jgi:ribonuclease HI